MTDFLALRRSTPSTSLGSSNILATGVASSFAIAVIGAYWGYLEAEAKISTKTIGVGGGGSHRRAGLRFAFPCLRGEKRTRQGSLALEAGYGELALALVKKFLNRSLRIS